MLIHLLREIQERIFKYCSIQDLRNLSLTSSVVAYNETLKRALFHTIRIPSYLEWNSKMTKTLENLKYTKVLHFYHGSDPVMRQCICNAISQLCNLTELNLVGIKEVHDTNICGSLLQLKVLNVSWSSVTDEGLAFVQKLLLLEELDISYCKVKELLHIAGLSSLKKLKAIYCYDLTDTGVDSISTLTSLKGLHVSYCTCITDMGIAHIASLTSLKELDVSGCAHITDEGMAHIASLTSLEKLNVSRCEHITDVGVAHISTLTCLQELNVSFCFRITDVGVSHISTLPSLEELDLHYCSRVTDVGVAHITRLTCLKELNVSDCSHITDITALTSFGIKVMNT